MGRARNAIDRVRDLPVVDLRTIAQDEIGVLVLDSELRNLVVIELRPSLQ